MGEAVEKRERLPRCVENETDRPLNFCRSTPRKSILAYSEVDATIS